MARTRNSSWLRAGSLGLSVVFAFSAYEALAADRDATDENEAFHASLARHGLQLSPGGTPNNGLLFVDLEVTGESGHVGQALTECANGDLLAFYSRVPGDAFGGHGTSGWSEYRRSTDGGKSWGEAVILPYSKEVWEGDDYHSALVDEVVTSANGTVIAFAGRYTNEKWGRDTPVYLTSSDHGLSWSGAKEVDPTAGVREIAREHDVLVVGGEVMVLFNAGTKGAWPGPHTLYVSANNGASFERRSRLPFDEKYWYGALTLGREGELIAYAYATRDESLLHYTRSHDQGRTWSAVASTKMAKNIRNPRVTLPLRGRYFLHGRSGQEGSNPRHLVLYQSGDGINWDQGIYLNVGSKTDLDSYSANTLVGRAKPGNEQKLLIQSSIAYSRSGRRVNLHHWWIEPIN